MELVVVTAKRWDHVAHHPTCSYAMSATSKHVVDEAELEARVRACRVCRCLPHVPVREQRKRNRKMTRQVRARGRNHVHAHEGHNQPPGRYRVVKGAAVVCECPSCGSLNIEREAGNSWFCWQCPWLGGVAAGWTKV